MREILFKGKRVDNGEWVEGSLLIDIDKKYVIIPSGKGVLSSFEVIPETVSQYTGLKDKNGNKIFEFDLVVDKDGNKTIIVWIKEWAMYGCMFSDEFKKYINNGIYTLDESMFWTFPVENNLIEIIGNIHEDGNK